MWVGELDTTCPPQYAEKAAKDEIKSMEYFRVMEGFTHGDFGTNTSPDFVNDVIKQINSPVSQLNTFII